MAAWAILLSRSGIASLLIISCYGYRPMPGGGRNLLKNGTPSVEVKSASYRSSAISMMSDQIMRAPLKLVDASYLIEIGLGTPTQLQQVIFDTGSHDIYVTATQCKVYEVESLRNQPNIAAECAARIRFDENASSTSRITSDSYWNAGYGQDLHCTYNETTSVPHSPIRPDNTPFDATLASCNATSSCPCPLGGQVASDILSVAGEHLGRIEFGLVSDLPPTEAYIYRYGGILGMDKMSTVALTTNMKSISFSLSCGPEGKNWALFNGEDPTYFTGDLVELDNLSHSESYLSMGGDEFWLLNVIGVEIDMGTGGSDALLAWGSYNTTAFDSVNNLGDVLLDPLEPTANAALFDSGTSNIVYPSFIYTTVTEWLIEHPGYNVSAISDLASMTLALLTSDMLSTFEVSINMQQMEEFSGSSPQVNKGVVSAGWVIGDPLMRNYYSSHNFQTGKVSIALPSTAGCSRSTD